MRSANLPSDLLRLSAEPSFPPGDSTGGGIVPSTAKAPETRVMLGSISGRSTRTSSAGGSLLAIDLSVICGTMPPTSSPLLFCFRL